MIRRVLLTHLLPARTALCAALIAFTGGVALAKDPNQAVKLGTAEFSSGFGYARYTGGFDNNGGYHKYPDSIAPAAYGIPLRIRLGLGQGVELKTEWSYAATNKDAGSREGFSQPSLGLRYIGKNFGLFENVTLPVATGDFDNGNLHTYSETGGLVRFKTARFRITGLASYIDDFDDNEILRLWARPEILWRKGFSTFLTGEYVRGLGSDAHGAYLATLGPGVRVDFNEAAALEVTTPFSAAGRNSPVAGWSISARGLWTLKY